MVDVSEIARFAPGERTLRLVMDIAALVQTRVGIGRS